jgi:transcriptional regulator with XRE-family HTH domain
MIVKKLRLQKCWSQEQLSQFSGLSVRTIQRIERGQQASLESLKSLAAVFQVNLNDIQMANTMDTSTSQRSNNITDNAQTVLLNTEEQQTMKYVEGIKSFYPHLYSCNQCTFNYQLYHQPSIYLGGLVCNGLVNRDYFSRYASF